MPGGNNPYTRPANKPERAALTRQSARNAALKNIEKRHEENLNADKSIKEFIRDLDSLSRMTGKIYGSGYEDRQILENMKRKSSDRKADMFKMEKGGAVPMKMDPQEAMKYMEGGAVKKRSLANKPRNGCVMSGRGGKFKGVK